MTISHYIKYSIILSAVLFLAACGAASPTMPTQIPTAIESADAVDISFVEISKDTIPTMEDSSLAADLSAGTLKSNYETECPEGTDTVFNIRCQAYQIFYYPESDPDYHPFLDNPFGNVNIYSQMGFLDFDIDIFQHGYSGTVLGDIVDIEEGGLFYGPDYCNRQDAVMYLGGPDTLPKLECYLIDSENGRITAPFFGTVDTYAALAKVTFPTDDGLRNNITSQAWRLGGTTEEKEIYVLNTSVSRKAQFQDVSVLAFYNSGTTEVSLKYASSVDFLVEPYEGPNEGVKLLRFDIDGVRNDNLFSIRFLELGKRTESESDDISNINDYTNLTGYGISRGAGTRFLLKSNSYEGEKYQYGYHCYDGNTKTMLAESISDNEASVMVPEECIQYAEKIAEIPFLKPDSSDMPFAGFTPELNLGP